MRRWITLLVAAVIVVSCAIPDVEIVDSLGSSGGSAGKTGGSGGVSAGMGGVPAATGGVPVTTGGSGGDAAGSGGSTDGGGQGGQAGEPTDAGAGGTGVMPECTEGAARCAADEQVEACVNGAWSITEACSSDAAFCSEGACVQCRAGTKRCNRNTPEECSEDGSSWVAAEACTGETPACLAMTGTCGRCAEGERQCSLDVPQRCNSEGTWMNQTACAGAFPQCLGGACVECDPGEGSGLRCRDATTPQVCRPDGSYANEPACTGATPICRQETGRCGCQDGERRCQGNTPQQCNAGLWANQTACSGGTPVCLASSGTCGCREGDVRCAGSSPERCTNGAWQRRSACSGETPVCSDGACVCRDGATRCASQVSTAARERCIDDRWQAVSACSGTEPICSGEGDCGCAPGALRCADSHTVALCRNDSMWHPTTCSDTNSACYQGECRRPSSVAGLKGCFAGQICESDEQCCFHHTTSTGECQPSVPTSTTCATTPSDFEYDCDGPNDCPSGQICCLTAFMRQVTHCSAASACSGSGSSIVCDVSLGVSNNPGCAAGQSCVGLQNGIIYYCM